MTTVADTPADVLGSLSPSRGGDFKSCPLRYRYRVIDRLPEPPGPAATRGTVVHAVLEQLYDLPAAERTIDAATALVAPIWAAALAEEPELASLFTEGGPDAESAWLASARDLVAGYFRMEDPVTIEPAGRELRIEHAIADAGVSLRGIIDRLDEAADGTLVVSDYKTGRSPGEGWEEAAFFGLKFYALLLWRTRGVVPSELRLLYLADQLVVRYQPDEAQLRGFEKNVLALWRAIKLATERGDWRHRPSRLCEWCSFQAHCPEYGGTVLPLPENPLEVLLHSPETLHVVDVDG